MEPYGKEDGWKRKRKRKKRKEKEEKGPEVVEERLLEASAELQSSDFWDSSRNIILKSVREHLVAGQEPPPMQESLLALENLHLAEFELGTRPRERGESDGLDGLQCVCYGVGNFSSCVVARYQLAFLMDLLEELQIPRHFCHVFDPVFSDSEIEILNRLGFTVIKENEEGKRSVSGPTVFYMIHCGKALYNNLLWRNWAPEALSKMAVIGNSFRGIEERIPGRLFRKEYGYIAKISGATDEVPFPPHPQYQDIFSDTSVHCFSSSKLRDLPLEIWTSPQEPVYHEEDLEIIRKEP